MTTDQLVALRAPCEQPSEAAIQAAARASGFMEEDAESPDMLMARGVAKMLRAAYAIDLAPLLGELEAANARKGQLLEELDTLYTQYMECCDHVRRLSRTETR